MGRRIAPLESASFRPKRLKSSLWPFRVTKSDQKVVCSHFGSPETTKKRFAAISGRQKRPKRGLRPFRATRSDQKEICSHFGSPVNGFEGWKGHFMRHDAASTAGNAISCDMKRLRRPEMPSHATRNGFDGRKCHFMRHETASTVGNVISCDIKRLRRSEMPSRATRNDFDDRKCHFMRHDAAPEITDVFSKDALPDMHPVRTKKNRRPPSDTL